MYIRQIFVYSYSQSVARTHTTITRTHMTQTAQEVRRQDVRESGTYDIYIEIDIDCEELVDACGLDYERTDTDDTQNEICLSLDRSEWVSFKESMAEDFASILEVNEQVIGAELLNYELGEYVTKVTIYKPDGNIISFC